MTKQKSKFTKVLKFGGSSVGSAERIKGVCKIIVEASKHGRIAVVVSAMQGITDKLLALCAKGASASGGDFNFVKEKHLAAAKELKIPAPLALLNELEKIIGGIKSIGDASPMALDLVAGFGERLSAELIASYLNKKKPARAVDSRLFIKTDSNFSSYASASADRQNAAVDFKKTNAKIRSFFKTLYPKPYTLNPIPVITGFIASTSGNQTTTLGRGGSDYTAAIIGAALNADVIEIWTDTNGIMTADPRVVPAAMTLPQISYEEAFEMAYFGAKVIYPPTIVPAIKKGIPVLIKNTFNPKHPGTTIAQSTKHKAQNNGLVKNISAIDGVGLITIGGTNLAGVPGSARRVFAAVSDVKANVILISQASSEHTICLAVNKNDVSRAFYALKTEFDEEISRGRAFLEAKDDQSVIAVVGDNMRGVPGIAGRIFSSLGQNKINISAIAQGASERNVSFVVDRADKESAIAVIHDEFFSDSRPAIFLIGTGGVGSELLRQISAGIRNKEFHPPEAGKGIKVCALANVQKMLFYSAGIDLKNWKKNLEKNGKKMDLEEYFKEAKAVSAKTKIFVDCTANGKIAKKYRDFAAAGFHIVTPNKKANVLPMKDYSDLRAALAATGGDFHYQANVGAGLPIIESVKNLTAAGDKIKKIEGIFSGTLSYLFNNFDGRRKFSAFVAEAKAKGYTEPDPREDLSGQDVGRKLLILAREMGLPLEFKDARLQSLADFGDDYFARRFKAAKAKKRVLRYIGAIKNGKLLAALAEIPEDDPLAHVAGADNAFAIYSANYRSPLVIKGPGAGVKVTAVAVLAGIKKIIKSRYK